MPSRPRAPATPAPTTAEGYEAPPVWVDEAPALEALAAAEPAAVVVVALREGEWTDAMVVVLREDEMLALMEAWTLEMEARAGVVVRGARLVETIAVEATSV